MSYGLSSGGKGKIRNFKWYVGEAMPEVPIKEVLQFYADHEELEQIHDTLPHLRSEKTFRCWSGTMAQRVFESMRLYVKAG